MANTYKWRINAVDCKTNENGLENLVYNIHWSYIGEDENNNVASSIGTQPIPHDENAEFIAFNDLTEEIVVGWLESEIGEERIAELKSNIDRQIQEMVAPKTVTLQLPKPIVEDPNAEPIQ